MKFPGIMIIAILILILDLWSGELRKNLGYSITLPDQWQVSAGDTQDVWTNSDTGYNSLISIVRHTISEEDFSSPEEWTRAYFIAYKLSSETSQEPYGAVIAWDSSHTRTLKNGSWAPACYSIFLSGEEDLAWEEFSVFSAYGNYGYEIYALGDTIDMKENVLDYVSLLSTVEITTGSSISKLGYLPDATQSSQWIWKDVLGRKLQRKPVFSPLPGTSALGKISNGEKTKTGH